MTEIDKIKYTKAFIDKLAEGINPIDNSVIPENDLFNNVRITRCMHYISFLLDKAIKNGGVDKIIVNDTKKISYQPVKLTKEDIKSFVFSEASVPVSYITRQLNPIAKSKGMIRIHQRNIRDLMLKLGYLEYQEEANGITTIRPSKEGIEFGLGLATKSTSKGDIIVITYNSNAQRFILENIDKVTDLRNLNDYNNYQDPTTSNRGKPWTVEQEEIVKDLFNQGKSIKEIAEELKRTAYAVQLRLEKLGLIA